ncbi:hypothetical protein TH30_19730 [Thalassospira profundimaris]|uniref:Uncharacterized protein n=1 Tax=Thalassospira profundimaris TaxID=502049 RepID=A0A367WP45_9PROT|nr:hypothetical protein TH30_19730 [Thalassospira profundimaris]
MKPVKDVIGLWGRQIGRRISTSIVSEAEARTRSVRRSFTLKRPVNGWWNWLLLLLWVCLRGWVYIVAIVLLTGWWLYDQSPGEMLELFKLMGAR